MALAQMAPLARVPGVRLYSLQLGSYATQLAPPPAGMDIVDLAPEIRDFADTAALIASLDLIISIDTSVSNLAGAIGVPVWVAVPFVADWRWGKEGRTTPWFPTATVYRQPAPDDWGAVLAAIVSDLRDLARSRREAPGNMRNG
jgi:hypothetical protein